MGKLAKGFVMVGLQRQPHGQVWLEAEGREPLRHWHSAPYATLEGYRLECDALRMMASTGADGFSAAKGELGQCDPLTQLQVCSTTLISCHPTLAVASDRAQP